MMLACFSLSPHDPLLHSLVSCPSSTTLGLGSKDAFLLLQKCSSYNQIRQVHAKIIRHHLSLDQLLVRKLLSLSSSHTQLEYATFVFHQLQAPLTFTWNLMIRALTSNGRPREALVLFTVMISRGFPPDKFTFPFVIKACLASSAIHTGKQVHALTIKTGFSWDVFVQNTLMDLYFKCGHVGCGRRVFEKMRVRSIVSWTTMVTGLVSCGELGAAQCVFSKMPSRNVVSWTAMISGYVRNERPEEALELFGRMLVDNVRPNEFTLVSLLKACTQLGSSSMGQRLHDYAHKNGFKLGVFLGTALIDMYSKCGSLQDARKVFDMMQTKSLATWNSMITSLGVHGCGEEALSLFEQMQKANIQPDAITFAGVLCACARTKNVKAGIRFFKHMTEHYGIAPVFQHYVPMVELYNHANMSDEVCSLILPVSMHLNPDTAEALPSVGCTELVRKLVASTGFC